MFVFHQATRLHSKLRSAKSVYGMATMQPLKHAPLPGPLAAKFGAPWASYVSSTGDAGSKEYVFQLYDDDRKPTVQYHASPEEYQEFRRACMPRLQMPDGTMAVYLECKGRNDQRLYRYMDAANPGRITELGLEQH